VLGFVSFHANQIHSPLTSIESHVHTLLNIVYLSGIPTRLAKNDIPELDCKNSFFISFIFFSTLLSCAGAYLLISFLGHRFYYLG
jgi:hypothetical protein